jgi:hypothetical protein
MNGMANKYQRACSNLEKGGEVPTTRETVRYEMAMNVTRTRLRISRERRRGIRKLSLTCGTP